MMNQSMWRIVFPIHLRSEMLTETVKAILSATDWQSQKPSWFVSQTLLQSGNVRAKMFPTHSPWWLRFLTLFQYCLPKVLGCLLPTEFGWHWTIVSRRQ